MLATTRTEELLDVLTTKVRLLTLGQVARTWFGDHKSDAKVARQYLRRLKRAGLVMLNTAMAHPEIRLYKPLLDWHPGDQTPTFHRLSWRARSRFREAPERTLVITATARARALTGGSVGRQAVRPTELAHDISLAGIFLLLQRERPEVANTWRHEDELLRSGISQPGEKYPDAKVEIADVEVAIELAGTYSGRKLQAIHESLKHARYDLW